MANEKSTDKKLTNEKDTEKDMKKETSKRSKYRGRKGKRDSKNAGSSSVAQREASASKIATANIQDPSWYAATPQLFLSAYSLSTPERVGVPIRVDVPKWGSSTWPYTTKSTFRVSGLCNLLTVPIPGISTHKGSAVNQAASYLFSIVRKMNAGYSQYEPADMMLYILALDSAVTLWQWMQRVYGILLMYSSTNDYVPDALLEAMQVDRDIAYQMPQLLTLINMFAAKLNTFAIPNFLPIINRHRSLYQHLYMDNSSSKSQIYMFNPAKLFKWVEPTEQGVLPYLEPVDICLPRTVKINLDVLKELVNTFINPLIYSDDFKLIGGDLRKAFPPESLLPIPDTPEDYAIAPILDEDMLISIENAKLLCSDLTNTSHDTSWRIGQRAEDSAIIFHPTVRFNVASIEDEVLYNFHTMPTAPEQFAYATKFNFLVNDTIVDPTPGSRHWKGKLWSANSEIILGGQLFNFKQEGLTGRTLEWTSFGTATTIYKGEAQNYGEWKPYLALSQFNRAPIAKICAANGDGSEAEFLGYVGDLDNYTQISTSAIANINDVAIMSMFGLPATYGGKDSNR